MEKFIEDFKKLNKKITILRNNLETLEKKKVNYEIRLMKLIGNEQLDEKEDL